MAETPTDQTPATPSSEELNKAITQVATDAALEDKNIPLEVKVGAQVFKGSTPQELLSELTKAQENATNLIRQQKEELERLRQDRVTQTQPQTQQDTDEYNPEKFYELFAKDPRKAQEYQDQFDTEKQELRRTLETVRRQSEIDRFKSAVGFSPTPEEAMIFGQEFQKSGLE